MLARMGASVRVEALSRAGQPNPAAPNTVEVHYAEEDTRAAKLGGLARLVTRHPVRSARDAIARRRWRGAEPVRRLRDLAPAAVRIARGRDSLLHSHFAKGAALDAMRLAGLLGLPWSVTPHAYDIFKEPSNLEEKLVRATFVTTGCEYNRAYLRGLMPPASRERVHKIVMGVDPQLFKRGTPYRAEGAVLAVGRLVEKKGFGFLIEAAALMRGNPAFDRLVIVGEGHLRGQLERQVQRLGLADVVELRGARSPDAVREALEQATVLAMPAVVAADGDRDSMPLVVKEALAMEVPVVASAEVGLPEVVDSDCGRLVPPGDVEGLAAALGEVLALDRETRVAMGRAGRRRIVEKANLEHETRRLRDLIHSAI